MSWELGHEGGVYVKGWKRNSRLVAALTSLGVAIGSGLATPTAWAATSSSTPTATTSSSASSSTSIGSSSSATPTASASTSPYTVQAGDTLYTIAQRYGLTVQALAAANPQIQNIDLIYPGETLTLPLTTRQLQVDNILATAHSLIGVKYTWGGSSPSTGFDCSGFVWYVFSQNGINLPRTCHDQATVGTFVPANQL
ncbi:MAG: LysM peptidoglycan-binding domain-containing C40 family peptidase, partial [Alicyclobacillus sp.]|nr:LysM peptidoglycan-binding domain-containing C40 family peptidase [Alicyclobacillus sp.]